MNLKNNGSKNQIFGTKYIPEYCANYFDKPWYEKDLMGYFDYLDIQICQRTPLNISKKKGDQF